MIWGKAPKPFIVQYKRQAQGPSCLRAATFTTILLLWKETPPPQFSCQEIKLRFLGSYRRIGGENRGREKLDLTVLKKACYRWPVDPGHQEAIESMTAGGKAQAPNKDPRVPAKWMWPLTKSHHSLTAGAEGRWTNGTSLSSHSCPQWCVKPICPGRREEKEGEEKDDWLTLDP